MKNRNIHIAGAFSLVLAASSPALADTGKCESAGGTGTFTTPFDVDWTKEQNVAGSTYTVTAPASGSGYKMDCTCKARQGINVYYASTTPLRSGHTTGWYQLNDTLDITMQVNDLPGGASLPIPHKTTDAIRGEGYYSDEDNTSLCTADAESAKANAPFFNVGSNTTITLYVKKPFLGRLDIPATQIATVQAGWSNTLAAARTNFGDIAKIYLQGSITVPQNCTINQGNVIQVNLGYIDARRFTTRNQRPDGYTPVQFDVTYDCGDMSAIKNSLYMQISADDVVNTYSLVARRRASDNIPDVGIQVADVDDGNHLLPFSGGTFDINQSGTGTAHLQAFPVNLVGGTLEPGPFKGTATLTVYVR